MSLLGNGDIGFRNRRTKIGSRSRCLSTYFNFNEFCYCNGNRTRKRQYISMTAPVSSNTRRGANKPPSSSSSSSSPPVSIVAPAAVAHYRRGGGEPGGGGGPRIKVVTPVAARRFHRNIVIPNNGHLSEIIIPLH